MKATKSKLEGYPVTRVDILDHRGEEALGKPQGSYFTIDLTTFWQRKADFFERAVRAVGTELKALLPPELLPWWWAWATPAKNMRIPATMSAFSPWTSWPSGPGCPCRS